MHPPHVREEATRLIAAGINDCEISRRMGIPRGTIRDWRRPTYVPRPRGTCPRCWRPSRPMQFSPEDYMELLGLYLGDGSISHHARTDRLRIALDSRYPGIIEATRSILQRCLPENPVSLVEAHGGSMYFVSVYSTHLVCLFPQHGPGAKHLRAIRLEPWQDQLLEQAPWAFLRGCIRSDGCTFVNRTGPYEYLSYAFSNMSKDIVDLFTRACEHAGISDYRLTNGHGSGRWDVRINRRDSVSRMVANVGVKA